MLRVCPGLRTFLGLFVLVCLGLDSGLPGGCLGLRWLAWLGWSCRLGWSWGCWHGPTTLMEPIPSTSGFGCDLCVKHVQFFWFMGRYGAITLNLWQMVSWSLWILGLHRLTHYIGELVHIVRSYRLWNGTNRTSTNQLLLHTLAISGFFSNVPGSHWYTSYHSCSLKRIGQ